MGAPFYLFIICRIKLELITNLVSEFKSLFHFGPQKFFGFFEKQKFGLKLDSKNVVKKIFHSGLSKFDSYNIIIIGYEPYEHLQWYEFDSSKFYVLIV